MADVVPDQILHHQGANQHTDARQHQIEQCGRKGHHGSRKTVFDKVNQGVKKNSGKAAAYSYQKGKDK
jgi:hypothetical protein